MQKVRAHRAKYAKAKSMYSYLKRLVDIVVSFLALSLIWPFLLLIAIVIRLESEGAPFFLQTRTGKNLKPFRIVKFRSMIKDADKKGGYSTQEGDARITKMGALVRKTSLDELPQLWNVLVGDMSLIGPRPNTPAQEEQYSKEAWNGRHAIRPGITGLAQVSGRSALTTEKQVEYDLKYVQEHSLSMDISIIIKTIMQVLRKTGVN